ncbi:hypothetical protein EGW08_021562 [Elysia chlorotica]|uniref:Uncharacterized protein n=1 Tax=Elysia chlorotica TaxID=188477 RepID=A0A3S1AX93_ELYCH|nr:hypothetical protein EGW08_021562 [Elysia chlorotica]
MGPNVSQSSRYRYTLWDKQIQTGPDVANRSCVALLVFGNGYNEFKVKKKDEEKTPAPTMMRIIPVVNNSRALFTTNAANRSIDSRAHKGMEDGDEKLFLSPRIIVELTNTRERRFHCPSLKSRLEDCVLVKCAEGLLLWQGNGSQHDRSCISPVEARVSSRLGLVRVPFCICVRVMTLLNEMGQWRTKLKVVADLGCVVELIKLPTSE